MTANDFPEVDKCNSPVFIDYQIYSLGSIQHLHYLKLLLMQRIAFQITVTRAKITHKSSIVQIGDRALVRHARHDQLASPGKSGHKMGLHQADDYSQVRFHQTLIQ